MKHHLGLFIALVLTVGMMTTACVVEPLQFPTPAPAKETADMDPVTSVVMELVDRFNAGDLEGVLELWADDGIFYVLGLPPTGTEVYAGKEALRTIIGDNIANHLAMEVDVLGVEDSVVTTHTQTWHDFTRALEVAPLDALEVYEVKDGKIATVEWVLSEASLAQLRPALAAVMPAEDPPAPATETPASALTVTIADGTCAYDGPMTLQAGDIDVTVTVADQAQDLYALTLFTLDPDKDIIDLMASTIQAGPPAWADMVFIQELAPGATESHVITVDQGPLYAVCWSQPPALAIGGIGPFAVSQ
jgi:hypothetical protein